MTTDRIEKTILLHVPRARVWRALTNAEEFGAWFGVNLEGAFVPGEWNTGRIKTPGYDHLTMSVLVETMTPERLFSYRWHPYAIDPDVDYSSEPTTLVEFHLEDAPEGTRLTIVESGFDAVPVERRAEAFRMNSQGWSQQVQNIAQHVAA